jgi:hypothetical protein
VQSLEALVQIRRAGGKTNPRFVAEGCGRDAEAGRTTRSDVPRNSRLLVHSDVSEDL